MPPTTSPPRPLRANLRNEWLLANELTFLNHGSFGAVPRPVFDAQTEWRRQIEADPVEHIGRRSAELIETAKLPVGERFGMRVDNFGFVTNATEGVNAVLRSLALKPGDELLTTRHVYHAVRQTMKVAARRAGATCREVSIPLPVTSSQVILRSVEQALSPLTRLLVIDHVTSPTGLIFPIAEIIAACRSRGVDVLVDGAHVPGMLPLNVESLGAAYYVGNLHKWSCAPKGTAFLWVDPGRQADVHPTVISHNLDGGFAREFDWQGTRDLSAWLAAPAALDFFDRLGWDDVLTHNHQLATWAHQLLVDRWNVEPISPLDGRLLGSMAALRLPGRLSTLDSLQFQQLQQTLHNEYHVEVPLVGWPGGNLLRVSCQVYNVPVDYEKLADTIVHLGAHWPA